MIKRNKAYSGRRIAHYWRKVAMASWARPNDPTTYGVLELNCEKALSYIEQEKKRTGSRITITHFIGRAMGEVLKRMPEVNTQIRFGSFYQRKTIDILFQVAIEQEHGFGDLSGAMVRNIDKLQVSEIADILNQEAKKVRQEGDPDYKKIKSIARFIPSFLMPLVMSVLRTLTVTFNVWSPLFGFPKDAFGSIQITNVGALGLDFAFAPIYPPSHCPLILAVGAIYKAPVYDTDTSFHLERHIRLCVSLDHRYGDGLQGARGAKILREVFSAPERAFSGV
jgi:pyruvate/2-oxoglutarate dehydrogenase complex dihydrolipoamide acyltransferase (E2) component